MEHAQTHQDKSILFLKKKINEIKTALFKPETDSPLSLSANLVRTISVEDDRTISFFTTYNGEEKDFTDRSFHASLDYYKKGADCNIKLSGNAVIVDSPCEYFFSAGNNNGSKKYSVVLIKMKIMHAEFFEKNIITPGLSWLKKVKNSIAHFFQPLHRIYNFV